MSEEIKNASDNSGSANGDNTQNDENNLDEKQVENLEKKLGEQGKELGEYREFFENVSPLLEKLDENPALVDAILEGKINSSLIDAASKGDISVKDAKEVTKAYGNVKKELGKEKFDKLSSDKIEELVNEKISKLQSDIEVDRDVRDYQQKIQNFISKTDDFDEYAKDINGWLDEHPDVVDISVAYYAVKGKKLDEKQRKDKELSAKEDEKNMASSSEGGYLGGAPVKGGADMFDRLVANKSNPNSL